MYNNFLNIFLSLAWILVFTWNNGFGLEISWWVYIVAIILWILYLKFNKILLLILFLLFFLNLHINHLFGISNWKFDFNIDQINITNYKYIEIVNRYRLENIFIPYKIRMIFYSSWLMIFYWLDSFFKIISPLLWVRVLGFSGFFVAIFGLFEAKQKYLIWFVTVCLSSSLAILYDTKTALILTLPVVVLILANGLNTKIVKKYWWIVLILMVIDLIQK
jgi:hypothetical protein